METLVVLGHFAKWSQQLKGEGGVGEVSYAGARSLQPMEGEPRIGWGVRGPCNHGKLAEGQAAGLLGVAGQMDLLFSCNIKPEKPSFSINEWI